MAYYERLVTDMHFKKLILLSKLIIASYESEKFKRIETNAKKISGDELNQKDKKTDAYSKFQKEDKDRIIQAFNPELS